MENGSWEVLGSKGLLKKHEFIRILVQCLYSLGYTKSASCLEYESHVSYKSADFELLEMQVLGGNWDSCIAVLDRILDNSKDDMRNTILYLVFKQCLFEYLRRGDTSLAFNVLRKQAPLLRVGKEKIHRLACDILSSKEMESGEVDNCLVQDLRIRLLDELEKLIPSPIVIPERRLEHLVETAVMNQIDSCLYHNSRGAISLYEDHLCGRDQIPSKTVQVLFICHPCFHSDTVIAMNKNVSLAKCCSFLRLLGFFHIDRWMGLRLGCLYISKSCIFGCLSPILIVSPSLIILQILTAHKNEVWFVQFSNNGGYLATASSDCTAIIWKVPFYTVAFF